eukprot:TRINITY_DN2235_c0_g2_i1.p1 TRINITY_DN2235_c0_g2~~TRINITY_DN2235_c0_g2_i1.p1  ORF type:complete len:263 (+),score=45.86 TRINITY_DN2235_c0_g2_i1:183-971(+)
MYGSSSDPRGAASSSAAHAEKQHLLSSDGKPRCNYYDEEAGLPTEAVYACDLQLGLRMAFIRKVYGVLLIQLLATAAFCILAKISPGMQTFVLTGGNVMVCFVLSIALLCALFALRQVYPWNIVCLAAWTLTMADIAAVTVLTYSAWSVLVALFITMTIFLGLTAYTLQSKRDFSGLGVGLFCGLIVLLVVIVVQMFFPVSSAMATIIAAFGALLFCGFIVYDTWRLMRRLTIDDWVLASVSLYLDVLNLFTMILQLVGDRG